MNLVPFKAVRNFAQDTEIRQDVRSTEMGEYLHGQMVTRITILF